MRTQHIVYAGLGVGSMAWLGGVIGDGVGPDDLRSLGALVTIWMLVWLFSQRSRRVETVIFELGRKTGFDDGYKQGRRVGRPTIVPLYDSPDEVPDWMVEGHKP